MSKVKIIGAGLAGCEAAWQLLKRGIVVELYEMRPEKMTPAHKTSDFAELVCSNSFRGASLENAVGLLKEEMRMLDSLVMKAAAVSSVPAGGALAVDRKNFSEYITESLLKEEKFALKTREVKSIQELGEENVIIIATGPLTSECLAKNIAEFIGEEHLYFYDAAAPIVYRDSLDLEKIFYASRYGKGEGEYLNCPMNKEEYLMFWEMLVNAKCAEVKSFEKMKIFEGCMPIEIMASRGVETMRFGPLKPVGLLDPRTNRESYAVVQLRQDNYAATLYNMVGFQTHLKWGEQERVFRMIPGMEKAEFARFGVMHRNTFVNAPKSLLASMQTVKNKKVFFAGQMTGVEGYVESAASGLVAGINAEKFLKGENLLSFPKDTALGALCAYIANETNKEFQPMNVNFGLLPVISALKGRKNKKEKYRMLAERSLNSMALFKDLYNI